MAYLDLLFRMVSLGLRYVENTLIRGGVTHVVLGPALSDGLSRASVRREHTNKRRRSTWHTWTCSFGWSVQGLGT